jgi:ABC-type Fe3+/spermidine/putrescine transport system ATPase subunit
VRLNLGEDFSFGGSFRSKVVHFLISASTPIFGLPQLPGTKPGPFWLFVSPPFDCRMQVQLDKIFVALSGRSVLSGLDLSIKSDEYVVILGPSGCGKTTTLRVIAGLQCPDQGTVFFDQTPVTTVLPRHRGVSMVFQQDGLYPHLTVEKSIRFGISGKSKGSSRLEEGEIRRRLDQAAKARRF